MCYFTYTNSINNPETGKAMYSVKGYAQLLEPTHANWVAMIFDNYTEGLLLSPVHNSPDLVFALLTSPYAIEIHHHGVPDFAVPFDSPRSLIPKKGSSFIKKTCKIIKPFAKVCGRRIMDAAAVAIIIRIGLLLNVDLPVS